jgi:hypothetical protein
VTIYLVALMMSFMLDVHMPTSLFDNVGWLIISVSSLNIFVNFMLVVIGSVSQLILAFKHRKYAATA